MGGYQPVIDLLLAAGAKKNAVNPKRITAYSYMVQTYNQEADAMQTMPVLGTPSINTPGLTELKSNLMPPGGPTAADFNGGQGIAEGFEDYSKEDAERDREMGTSNDDDRYY